MMPDGDWRDIGRISQLIDGRFIFLLDSIQNQLARAQLAVVCNKFHDKILSDNQAKL